ncbi:MAG: heme NO-binding domain-containing protein [Roseibacillus sp.]
MKGVVFTSFLEMVEEAHGFDMVDTLIEKSDLPSGGIYTAVGTYDHTEIVNLVVTLSQETEIEVPVLLQAFGKHLFGILIGAYPQFGEGLTTSLDMFESIEHHIHVEVRKLYPDAELPRFECDRVGPKELKMTYESSRHFEDLCEGLIRGATDHYKESATITRETLPDERELFHIILQ